ncbi:MAG: glycosyltransferase [Rhodopila sp.]|nr:glycosyltransferase [Rhodopila sp.]
MIAAARLARELSFVVNSIDDRRFSRLTANLRTVFGSPGPEVVRIPDARSMAEGLNRGARIARGAWLAFVHDDILFLNRDAPDVIAAAMAACDMFGACGTTRLTSGNWYDAGRPFTQGQVVAPVPAKPGCYELQRFGGDGSSLVQGIQALDGILIACSRDAFATVGGFDEQTYDGFVGYDIDISFRAALAGLRVVVACGLVLQHDAHVEFFNEEKLQAWEDKQRAFQRTFGTVLAREAGERGHSSVQLRDPRDAPAIVAGRRPSRLGSWKSRLGFGATLSP